MFTDNVCKGTFVNLKLFWKNHIDVSFWFIVSDNALENRAAETAFQHLVQLKVSGIKCLTFGPLGKRPGTEQCLTNQQCIMVGLVLGSPGKF
jgi:hypothetical protein